MTVCDAVECYSDITQEFIIIVADPCRRTSMVDYEIPEFVIDYPNLIANEELEWSISDNFMKYISISSYPQLFEDSGLSCPILLAELEITAF